MIYAVILYVMGKRFINIKKHSDIRLGQILFGEALVNAVDGVLIYSNHVLENRNRIIPSIENYTHVS